MLASSESKMMFPSEKSGAPRHTLTILTYFIYMWTYFFFGHTVGGIVTYYKYSFLLSTYFCIHCDILYYF